MLALAWWPPVQVPRSVTQHTAQPTSCPIIHPEDHWFGLSLAQSGCGFPITGPNGIGHSSDQVLMGWPVSSEIAVVSRE